MKNRKYFILVAIALGAILITIGLYFLLRGYFVNEDWTYDVTVDFYDEVTNELTNQDRLEITSVIENINVLKGEEGVFKAVLHGQVPENYRNVPALRLSGRAGGINMEVRYRKDRIDLKKGSLQLDVYIPDSYRNALTINSYSGDIYLNDDINREIIINTVSGFINAERIECNNFICQTVSGDISLKDIICMGTLDARNTSGVISLERIETQNIKSATVSGNLRISGNVGNVNVETVSGPVEVLLTGLRGQIALTGIAGDISLYVNASAAYDLNATTVTGNINVQGFDVKVNKQSEKTLQGRINGGGSAVNIKTTSGNIYIDRYSNSARSQDTA